MSVNGSTNGFYLNGHVPSPPRDLVPGESRLCRHCALYPASRARRLCTRCYADPDVRDLYPPTSPYAYRSVGNCFTGPPLPPEPTQCLPGTQGKIDVMAERLRKGYHLHHPLDAKWDGQTVNGSHAG